MKIFVSHSSADANLARALMQWLKSALVGLRSSDVRCTSIDGHGLAIGTDFGEQLRNDVCGCEALIVLLTPNAIRSSYVLLELGARWGTKRPILPVIVGAQDSSKVLPLPLAALHAANGANDAQMFDLLAHLAKLLGLEAEPPAAHLQTLGAFAAIASTHAADQNIIPFYPTSHIGLESRPDHSIGRISSPDVLSQVPQRTLVSGELTQLGSTRTAWLLVAAKNGKLYPQASLAKTLGKWTQAVNIGRVQQGFDTGFEYTIMLVAAGTDSNYMFERCVRGHAESDDGIAARSINPSDLTLLDSRVIVRAD